jgi:sugar lactone lactonase YvrE
MQQRVDCDGDGYADNVCIDAFGRRYMLSGAGTGRACKSSIQDYEVEYYEVPASRCPGVFSGA